MQYHGVGRRVMPASPKFECMRTRARPVFDVRCVRVGDDSAGVREGVSCWLALTGLQLLVSYTKYFVSDQRNLPPMSIQQLNPSQVTAKETGIDNRSVHV